VSTICAGGDSISGIELAGFATESSRLVHSRIPRHVRGSPAPESGSSLPGSGPATASAAAVARPSPKPIPFPIPRCVRWRRALALPSVAL
jgi:hypothetical protein